MIGSKQKTEILDSIYRHIEESEWLDGLDLYQGSKVRTASEFNGLITGNVEDRGRQHEVRIKIHPAGHCIQWIECTCRTNRIGNRYCAHIAGFMLHIDREQASLVAKLDAKMPVKPPSPTKAKRKSIQEPEARPGRTKTSKASSDIILQMQTSIHSVSLLAGGPTLRVRLELKEGHLTHYDLDTDEAAQFLRKRPQHKTSDRDLKKLKVFKHPAECVFLIGAKGKEGIVVHKALLLPKDCQEIKSSRKFGIKVVTVADANLICRERSKRKLKETKLLQLDGLQSYVGQHFIFVPSIGYIEMDTSHLGPQWKEQLPQQILTGDQIPQLISEGFSTYLDHGPIVLESQVSMQEIIDIPQIDTVEVKAHQDGWFSLDPQYGRGRDALSLARLLEAFRKSKRKYIKSGDSWLKVPEYLRDIDWQIDRKNQSIKLNALGLFRLKAMMGDMDRFAGRKESLDQIRNLVDRKAPEAPPPLDATKLKLRPYQQEGFEWLWWLYKNGLHGLLADEMGLGKTHQAMALMSGIQSLHPQKSFLVICPTTVIDHWLDKLEQFAPNLRAYKHHGAQRMAEINLTEDSSQTIVTSYGVIMRDIDFFEKYTWGAAILDEAHAIKNNNTATYRAVCRLSSDMRICLSGTPMENRLQELKSVFDFLVPGYLGSDAFFRENFVKRIQQDQDLEAESMLQRLIHPLKLRRNKSQVLKELPDKVEDKRRISLSEQQALLYREVLELRARPLIDQLMNENQPVPYLHVFATLTMLKQICNHPALILKDKDYQSHSSYKFELLKELLTEALDSDHKIVIYSQYLDMIEIICKYLASSGVNHVSLTGQSRNRGQIIKKFQTDPDTKVFVGSLLAGGIGIDLTAASVVIHYDRWWNASKENQATDRVHRIGQTRNVQVLKLICKGTLEEKIDLMIQSKHNLFERFINQDEEVFKQFSRQELIELLDN